MTKRLFAALKINASNQLREVLGEFQNSLKKESIKWVEIQNIHITMKFFGDTEENEISKLSTFFKSVVSKINTFDITIEKAGYFGPSASPRVIWFGIKENPELAKLAKLIDSGLSEMGYDASENEFKPHLTIGRIKFIKDVATLKELITEYKSATFQTEKITELKLYESILRREGPVYKAIESYRFQA